MFYVFLPRAVMFHFKIDVPIDVVSLERCSGDVLKILGVSYTVSTSHYS